MAGKPHFARLCGQSPDTQRHFSLSSGLTNPLNRILSEIIAVHVTSTQPTDFEGFLCCTADMCYFVDATTGKTVSIPSTNLFVPTTNVDVGRLAGNTLVGDYIVSIGALDN